jgi:hypothetical protein
LDGADLYGSKYIDDWRAIATVRIMHDTFQAK